MAAKNVGEHLAHGNAIVKRLVDQKLPAKLGEFVDTFTSAQGALKKACAAVDEAEKAKDKALTAIHDTDAKLDESLDPLATAAAGEGIGTRLAPFEDFTTTPVSKIKILSYKAEAELVITIVDGIDAKSSAKKVAAASGTTRKHAKAVLDGLDAYEKKAAAYAEAIQARDALLPDQQKALASFKTQATAALADKPEKVAALFAPADAVAAPKKMKDTTLSKADKKALKDAAKKARSAAKAATRAAEAQANLDAINAKKAAKKAAKKKS